MYGIIQKLVRRIIIINDFIKRMIIFLSLKFKRKKTIVIKEIIKAVTKFVRRIIENKIEITSIFFFFANKLFKYKKNNGTVTKFGDSP